MKSWTKIALAIFLFLSSDPISIIAQPTARLQFINASADPNISSIDVYVNDNLIINDFGYLQATAWFDVLADEKVNLRITHGDNSGIIFQDSTQFDSAGVYVAATTGVINPSRFGFNPDGRPTDFDIKINSQAQETPPANPARVWFGLMHAATDLEGMEVSAKDAGVLQDDIKYSGHTGYKSLVPDVWSILLRASADTNIVYDSFLADLSALRGQTAVMLFAGFRDPSANLGGSPLGMYIVLDNGTVLPMPINTSNEGQETGAIPSGITLRGNYPNPFNPSTQVVFNLERAADVNFKVFDAAGRVVKEMSGMKFAAGNNISIEFEADGLPSGLYFYSLSASTSSGKFWTGSGTMSLIK